MAHSRMFFLLLSLSLSLSLLLLLLVCFAVAKIQAHYDLKPEAMVTKGGGKIIITRYLNETGVQNRLLTWGPRICVPVMTKSHPLSDSNAAVFPLQNVLFNAAGEVRLCDFGSASTQQSLVCWFDLQCSTVTTPRKEYAYICAWELFCCL